MQRAKSRWPAATVAKLSPIRRFDCCLSVCLSDLQEGADGAVQSLVLDLALRLVRGGGGADLRSLIGAASRLSGGGGGAGAVDPSVAKLAQQLLAEAGPV